MVVFSPCAVERADSGLGAMVVFAPSVLDFGVFCCGRRVGGLRGFGRRIVCVNHQNPAVSFVFGGLIPASDRLHKAA